MARKVYKEWVIKGEESPNFNRLEVIYLTAEYSYQRWVTWERITKLLRSLYDQVSAEFLKGEIVTINVNDRLPNHITPYRVLQYRLEDKYQGQLEIVYKPRLYVLQTSCEPIWNADVIAKNQRVIDKSPMKEDEFKP